MKELLRRLEEAEEKANQADAAWEQEPENEKLEKAFDEAYKEEFKAFEELVNAIVEFTNEQIDQKTARSMIRVKRAEIKELIERIA